jgi:hypothetical protein
MGGVSVNAHHAPTVGEDREATVLGSSTRRESGVREVLALDVGPSQDVALWRAILPDLVVRGA